MFPRRTTALPSACVKEPLLWWGGRNCAGERPFARTDGAEGSEGRKWARRKGCGESFAKVSRENDSTGWAGVSPAIVAMVYICEKLLHVSFAQGKFGVF